MKLRVMHVGLGPIGAAVARQVAEHRSLKTVAAVEIDPNKLNRDVGEVIGLDRRLRVRVSLDIGPTIRASKPDVVVLSTSSSLRKVLPQIEAVLKHKVPVVATSEELSYPVAANRRLAARLDAAARKAKVAVLSTGVNPGFVMDALPIALTATCERVDSIRVDRVQDARIRRVPFQQKIGAGLTLAQFHAQVADGSVRHVGMAESMQMIADSLGWKLTRVTDDIQPKVAERAVEGDLLAVDPGYVSGLIQDGVGFVGGEAKIALHMEAYLGAPESYDAVTIEGSPRIYSRIEGGLHGDIATASLVVNSIPRVVGATPGLRTVRDMPLPAFCPR